jgi:DNA polymerase-3 subunit alpha
MGTGATWDYADLKKGDPDDIDYWDESIRFALAETFGIIAYQEQVMTICMELGGFTGGQADDMRKAMGKLYRLPGSQARKFMSGFKSQWDKGTKERGIKPAVAEDIWKKILAFGGYGFNKSHSACYALQAYQDAHLKAYYPHEFYCALLHYPPSTTQKNAEEKSQFIRALIREASVFDVEVAPPDINRSARYFALDNQDRLRFGLGSINDVGLVAAQEILDKRPFKSWEDFQERVPAKKANQKVRTALIESGAADAFHMRDQYSGTEIMKFERARLGVSLTMPSETQQHAELIEANIHSNDEFETIEDGKEVIAGGDVIEVKPTQTKKGEDMAFVQLAFGANQWRCVFFPGQWKAYQDLIERGRMMVVGKKDTWNATVSIKVNQAIDIETWAANIAQDEEERVAG